MRRILHMSPGGRFTVSDDPDSSVSTALTIALAPHNRDRWVSALAPDGEGLEVQGIGTIARAHTREELPLYFEYDESIDPVANEIWWIGCDFTPDQPDGTWAVITGDELRALVQAGDDMRAKRT